ncbi:nitroreductase family protein [Pseudonocardia benzenivorans]
MEFKQVVGDRRTIRFFEPNEPVEPEKIQVMLEAANRASRAVNADFIKAIVCYRDELSDDVREQLKTPTTTVQLDLAPVAIFWYGDLTFAEGAQDRLKELTDLGALPVTHGWSHAYVDEVAYAQVVEPLSKDTTASIWAVSVECGLAIAQAMLAGVDEGLGVGLHAFNSAVAKEALGCPTPGCRCGCCWSATRPRTAWRAASGPVDRCRRATTAGGTAHAGRRSPR